MASHPRVSAVRPDAIRGHNLSLLLGHLHRDGALTRAELTQRLALSRSTIGALVADLVQLGLAEEVVPTGGAGVGRPSYVVEPDRLGAYAIGVDVDITQVTLAIVHLGGVIAHRDVVHFDAGRVSPAELVGLVVDVIARAHHVVGTRGRLCGVGISIPGTVELETGHVDVAPNLGWKDVQLGQLLEAAIHDDIPVLVGNDADFAVWAEYQRGSVRGCDNVVYLLGRIGVGAGIIIGGQPARGRDGHAGEIGHNVLDPTGPPCDCGNRGCVETFLGDNAILALAGRPKGHTGNEMAQLFADARYGDPIALRAIEAAAEPLGRTIASLLNMLNPERVLLGGSLADVLELARPQVEETVLRNSFGPLRPTASLTLPLLGADSALLGAAELAFADLLANPR